MVHLCNDNKPLIKKAYSICVSGLFAESLIIIDNSAWLGAAGDGLIFQSW